MGDEVGDDEDRQHAEPDPIGRRLELRVDLRDGHLPLSGLAQGFCGWRARPGRCGRGHAVGPGGGSPSGRRRRGDAAGSRAAGTDRGSFRPASWRYRGRLGSAAESMAASSFLRAVLAAAEGRSRLISSLLMSGVSGKQCSITQPDNSDCSMRRCPMGRCAPPKVQRSCSGDSSRARMAPMASASACSSQD